MLLSDQFHACFREVAAFGCDGPFVVDLDEYGTGEPEQRGRIGGDADDLGAPFHFPIDPL
jgi:hypothetical protein